MTDKNGFDEKEAPGEHRDLTVSPETIDPDPQLGGSLGVGENPARDTRAVSEKISRHHLDFSINKNISGLGYLGLDTVLDRLGETAYPNEWGESPYWQHMPFRRGSKKFRAKRKHKGFWQPFITEEDEIHYRKLSFGKEERPEFRKCWLLYRQVVDEMAAAFYSGEIQAYGLEPMLGDIRPIDAAGIWAIQKIRIFYTGRARVRVDDESYDTFCVMVKENRFRDWLIGRDFRMQRTLEARLLERLGFITDKLTNERKYSLTKTDTVRVVSSVLLHAGVKLLKRDLDKNYYEKLVLKNEVGRTDTELKDAQLNDLRELETAIEAGVVAFKTAYPQLRTSKGQPKAKAAES